MSKNVFVGSSACQGCGALLGLKIALQALDNCIVVNSTGCVSFTGRHVKVPFINAGTNAAAVARGLCAAMSEENDKNKANILVYAGDNATRMNLQSLMLLKENITYICYNKCGFSGSERVLDTIAKHLACSAKYVATASIAFPDDFVNKLRKSQAISGFRFIELLAPCPVEWGFDASNTIEISRLAVETGFWPLYEVENGSVSVTKRPSRLESVERFFELQKGFRLSVDNIKAIQEEINHRWKMLIDGRLF
jgi:pyruvate ferredoxin oxidoreductase beta subunit